MVDFMQKNPKIIICTEKGKLEKYAILLCRSIRTFGGKLSNVEILSFAPRKGFEPSKQTLKAFEELGVIHENIELNTEYRTYPLANKPLVCAYVEEQYSNQNIVFIDSDQIVFNEPIDFELPNDCDLLIRPVDFKGVGFSSTEEPNFVYWKKLMEDLNFDVLTYDKLKTSTGDDIYPYFNSGLIITNTKHGLFKQWLKNFELIYSKNLLPDNGIFFLEQSLFSATVLQLGLNFRMLKNTYNYPFSIQEKLSSEVKEQDLSKLVTAHYHDLFATKNLPKFYTEFSKLTEKGRWLADHVKKLEIKPDNYFQKIKAKIKRKLLK